MVAGTCIHPGVIGLVAGGVVRGWSDGGIGVRIGKGRGGGEDGSGESLWAGDDVVGWNRRC